MAAVKLNATMQSDLVDRIDVYCSKSGLSRSSFLAVACSQYLDSIEKKPVIADAFGNMGKLFKLAIDGKIDTDEYNSALAALESAGDILKK